MEILINKLTKLKFIWNSNEKILPLNLQDLVMVPSNFVGLVKDNSLTNKIDTMIFITRNLVNKLIQTISKIIIKTTNKIINQTTTIKTKNSTINNSTINILNHKNKNHQSLLRIFMEKFISKKCKKKRNTEKKLKSYRKLIQLLKNFNTISHLLINLSKYLHRSLLSPLLMSMLVQMNSKRSKKQY